MFDLTRLSIRTEVFVSCSEENQTCISRFSLHSAESVLITSPICLPPHKGGEGCLQGRGLVRE